MSIEPFNDGLGNRSYRMVLVDTDPVLLDMVQAFYRDTKLLRSVQPPVEPEPEFSSYRTAMDYPPNCDGDNRIGQDHAHVGQLAEALSERTEGDE